MAGSADHSLHVILCESAADVQSCIDVRVTVFVDEQKFTMEDEIDGKDEAADHFLLMKTQPQEIVGTIRWWPSPDRTYSKLGRLAVLKPYRGLGAGRLLVKALEEHIASGKGKSGAAFAGKKEILVVANSQAYAEQFYAKLGYTREGEPFIEDGDPHVRMTKTIPIS